MKMTTQMDKAPGGDFAWRRLALALCLLPALAGCVISSYGDDGQTWISGGGSGNSGHQSVLTETSDSAPGASCTKPDQTLLVSVAGDSDGNVWVTTRKINGIVQAVPDRMTYAQVSNTFNSNSTSVDPNSVVLVRTYDLTCHEIPYREDSTQAVFECGSPMETFPQSQPVRFISDAVDSGSGSSYAQADLVAFKNPTCGREVTYQLQFVSWSGWNNVPPGLNGTEFPYYYDGSSHP